jgi:hypothetical protein
MCSNWNYTFAGDITQKGYEKKKAKILAPYLNLQGKLDCRLTLLSVTFPLLSTTQKTGTQHFYWSLLLMFLSAYFVCLFVEHPSPSSCFFNFFYCSAIPPALSLLSPQKSVLPPLLTM